MGPSRAIIVSMSSLRDLDEYEDEELERELERRRRARSKGLCDYCLRRMDTTPTCRDDRAT